jgi:hypothetical protein
MVHVEDQPLRDGVEVRARRLEHLATPADAVPRALRRRDDGVVPLARDRPRIEQGAPGRSSLSDQRGAHAGSGVVLARASIAKRR